MTRYTTVIAAFALTALVNTVSGVARPPDDEPRGSRAQERQDRDAERATERANAAAGRAAEDRAKIEERAARDTGRAAEDLAKIDAEKTRDETKAAEERAKIAEDFAEDAAKEAEDAAKDAEDAAEDAAKELAELAEDANDDSGQKGSSAELRDLARTESAEHDADGFPVRRGEVVAMDLPAEALIAAQAKGFRLIERQKLEGLDREIVRLAAPEGLTSMRAREQLREIAPAVVVDLVHYYGLNLTAGSHGKRIGTKALTIARGSTSLTVGMIDTAVGKHPALGKARLVAWPSGNLPTAPLEHGTAVASLLAGEGSATIFLANIFRGPASRPFTSADVIAQAFEWMVSSKVPTVNMSLAGPRNAILDRLIRDALLRGVQVVAAAGNGGPTAPPAYPAAVPGVVAVTAVDRDKRIYRYANRGSYVTVAAQGVGVIAARSAGGLAAFDGTSFATPHVAGWIARCRAKGGTAAACRDQLKAAARDLGPAGFDDTYGHGLIE
ncbi:S8 family serine peptidase [Novosphingobium sp. ERN07]|uniref:S8 family serine peptidase n=1 Tax=Novosphingobium sp. ERN07 TaxID=2726187 RepID=UPI0014573529|nr:S8 family serine peptidase [Novosphingobium sp. ERN07]NLR70028.1 S8 family serine peptidase [Novosphingobium sp. ERN07]